MSKPIAWASLVAVLLASQSASGFVELGFEVYGTHTGGGDFFMPPPGFYMAPIPLQVRLRGDQPISAIAWNWDVRVDGGSADLSYFSPVTHGNAFGASYYTGTAQVGANLVDSAEEGYAFPPYGRLTAPYDIIIATYQLDLDYIWSFMKLTLSARDKEVPLQWSYTYRQGVGPAQTITGTPSVVPFQLVNIGPEPSTALLLAGVAAVSFRRPQRRRAPE
jgi:hypothetical protein